MRYKRSMLGVWWTLLNPLLTVAVMWAVFSTIFRFEIPGGVPYVVYVLSGVMLITFFSQGVVASGSSIVDSAGSSPRSTSRPRCSRWPRPWRRW